MSHPLVRSRINERVSGRAHVWPAEWLAAELKGRAPVRRMLSIGCGTGDLERYLVASGVAAAAVGIDTAGTAIEVARQKASGEGLGHRLTYVHGDASAYLASEDAFDAIVFHQSLHHFDDPHGVLAACRERIRPEGVLILDEYVGPSRDEWRWYSMLPYNLVYYTLPAAVRRPRLVRRPVNVEDPTEAIASSAILPAVAANFEIVRRRDYGGQLLSVIYPNLRRPVAGDAAGAARFDAAVALLLHAEDVLLERRWLPALSRPFYTIVVARPRLQSPAER